MWLAVGFSLVACIGLTLMGSLSFHAGSATYHREHPTVVPDSVNKTEGRSLCYVLSHKTDHQRGGQPCTNPPSDQGWCSMLMDDWYYPLPAFCFRSYLDVRWNNRTIRFMKDCGTSPECAYAFDALGHENDFVIGAARYRIRPEEIALFVFGAGFGMLASGLMLYGWTKHKRAQVPEADCKQ
jgi:hypothetical protein